MGDTVDERSLKDGYAAEAIVSGEACGKRYMVTVSEKNSVGFLYDISNIENPTLAQVFHLSPGSEKRNPVLAYADGTLGEIDAESILFMEAEDSPNGKAGILFAGAWSTSTSFWEFNCGDDTDTATEVTPADDVGSEADDVGSEAASKQSVDDESAAFNASKSALAAAAIAFVAASVSFV